MSPGTRWPSSTITSPGSSATLETATSEFGVVAERAPQQRHSPNLRRRSSPESAIDVPAMRQIRGRSAGVHHVGAPAHDQGCGERGGGGNVVVVARPRGRKDRRSRGRAPPSTAVAAACGRSTARRKRSLRRRRSHSARSRESSARSTGDAVDAPKPRASAKNHVRGPSCMVKHEDRSPRIATSTALPRLTTMRVVPTSTRSPSRTSIDSVTRWPLRNVPLLLPRSST